ncbi:MAG: hypothetical protein IT337_15580 [Thermomicrobiales bacterium]|nr:hypothetical protein [Thermomicrobiales bacterium]
MTCIVGVVENGTIYMGSDSQVTCGWAKYPLADSMPKVFCKGEMLIGACGQMRANNVLRHNFTPPPHHPAETEDVTYIALHVVDALRETFKAAGVAKISESVEQNGESTFMIGYRGKLYKIAHDWATVQIAAPYLAIGSGQEYAYGVLFATEKKNPRNRITTALEAASTFDIGCSGPYVILPE